MKLSIITVNLNNATGLQKTIESVVAQTWLDFELIIIDGASLDGSVEVIQQYSEAPLSNGDKLEGRLRWISKPDSGVFQAMNKGIKMAKGEYLLFLNSGDFLVENHVLSLVFSFGFSVDILCGRCRVSDNEKIIYITDPPEEFSLKNFYKTTLSHQSTFIKRTLFERFGLYREDLRLMSDWEFWIRTIILGYATTKTLNFIIADYNLDGISSNENNFALSEKECEMVYNDLQLKNIIKDYDNWLKINKEMEIAYWMKSKQVLYRLIQFVYFLVKSVSNIKKKWLKA